MVIGAEVGVEAVVIVHEVVVVKTLANPSLLIGKTLVLNLVKGHLSVHAAAAVVEEGVVGVIHNLN